MIFHAMPTIIDRPTVIPCVGTKPKVIEEFAGRANSGHSQVNIARMVSPEGWAGKLGYTVGSSGAAAPREVPVAFV